MNRARPPIPQGPYLVVGLARSGVAAALALRERGETVIGLDGGAPQADGLQELERAGVEVHVGEDGANVGEDEATLLARARACVKSPGVPREAPVIAQAVREGMPVLGELELGWRLLENEVIAVTGTNGKTTTVEWIGHIHRTAGLPVAVAGNVGTALSSLVGRVDPRATIVCETSSFQLEDTPAFAPEAAVLLNISPDHLDRHGTFDAYVAAKLQVFANQTADDIAVLPPNLDIEIPGQARRIGWDEMSASAGGSVSAEGSVSAGGPMSPAGPVSPEAIGLPGRHNLENAMAAAAVCLARGVDPEAVREGLRTFSGVKHRLQEVARRDGVAYVNDSKATNVASTLVALKSFPVGAVHLIVGGQGKDQDFSALAAAVRRACRAVYLIGEDAKSIADALVDTGVPSHECGTLENAVKAARTSARSGEVVLLSPACASFDQFTDYEDRGQAFRALVETITDSASGDSAVTES